MNPAFSPKFKRNFKRILPIPIIFVFCGSVFLLVESAATQNQNLDPDVVITLSGPVLFFALTAIFIVGLLVGVFELIFLEKRFTDYSLTRKVLSKLLIYLIFFFLVILLTYPIAASLELDVPIWNEAVWQKFKNFLFSITLVSTLIQLSFLFFLSLIYTAVSENIGNHVLINFLTGKYHKPIEEERIFMFLDMKYSTTIAEKLGNTQYFEFLKLYYQTMSDPIIYSKGEVYQYIGDEVVVSWKVGDYTNNLNCLVCFYEIRKSIDQHQNLFLEKFGFVPEFKAGMHVGSVTIGEVGALKKEITYSGDVLNTTSRVQELCKKFNKDLIITGDLKNILALRDEYQLENLDNVEIRGKSNGIRLIALQLK